MLQLRSRFHMIVIQRNTRDGANDLALRFVKMPDAFGAFVGVNHVNVWPHADGLIRAFRLAYVAIDAFVGDDE